MRNYLPIFVIFLTSLFLLSTGCALVPLSKHRNIVYQPATSALQEQSLTVAAPKRIKQPLPVFLFIHGGNWIHGKKRLYTFLGNRMARKRVVTVVIDYPKSPAANYNDMAKSAAKSVKWVQENIAAYGGDPSRIYVGGHSAGGHLAALIGERDEYFDSLHISNPIKGMVLIDAAGLDMYGYMSKGNYGPDNIYLDIFTKDPEEWRKASPVFFVTKKSPPVKIYVGGKTYPSIAFGSKQMRDTCEVHQVPHTYQVLKGKKHIPMITQFFNPWNARYKEIIDFMK